jgi:hypothetical protein
MGFPRHLVGVMSQSSVLIPLVEANHLFVLVIHSDTIR